MWSLISGRTANFKQRVTLIVFFLFRQDWCGDLPPAKEKNVLHWLAVPARNATKITQRLVFVVVQKVKP